MPVIPHQRQYSVVQQIRLAVQQLPCLRRDIFLHTATLRIQLFYLRRKCHCLFLILGQQQLYRSIYTSYPPCHIDTRCEHKGDGIAIAGCQICFGILS